MADPIVTIEEGQTKEVERFVDAPFWTSIFLISVGHETRKRTHTVLVTKSDKGVSYTRHSSSGDLVEHAIVLGDSAISIKNMSTVSLEVSVHEL